MAGNKLLSAAVTKKISSIVHIVLSQSEGNLIKLICINYIYKEQKQHTHGYSEFHAFRQSSGN